MLGAVLNCPKLSCQLEKPKKNPGGRMLWATDKDQLPEQIRLNRGLTQRAAMAPTAACDKALVSV